MAQMYLTNHSKDQIIEIELIVELFDWFVCFFILFVLERPRVQLCELNIKQIECTYIPIYFGTSRYHVKLLELSGNRHNNIFVGFRRILY